MANEARRAEEMVKLTAAFHTYCRQYRFDEATAVRILDDLDWRMIATIAEIEPPSGEMRASVVKVVSNEIGKDPFRGLPRRATASEPERA